MADIERDAKLSDCGRYRFWLTRRWAPGPTTAFIMLNPSTADATTDDPTLRKCMAFARGWGDGSLVVVNLFAWRETNPKKLPMLSALAIGPGNDEYILTAARGAARVLCAWGVDGARFARGEYVLARLREAGIAPFCFGKTKEGQPRHPLYIPGNFCPEGM